MKTHLVYPISASDEALALKFMPRVWTHPQSRQPIAITNWEKMVALMRKRLANALMSRTSDGNLLYD